jgi:hypothetical protein
MTGWEPLVNVWELKVGETIAYRESSRGLENPEAPEQTAPGPYRAVIVSRESTRYVVRADGFQGIEPLYYVAPDAIIGIK